MRALGETSDPKTKTSENERHTCILTPDVRGRPNWKDKNCTVPRDLWGHMCQILNLTTKYVL